MRQAGLDEMLPRLLWTFYTNLESFFFFVCGAEHNRNQRESPLFPLLLLLFIKVVFNCVTSIRVALRST